MKKQFSILAVSIVIAGVALSLIGTALVSQAAPQALMARKIVIFQSGVDELAKETLVKNFGGEKIKDLSLVNGMAVLLPQKAIEALSGRIEVLRIDNDDIVFALGKPVCGNGIIEGGEKCGEPGLSDCLEGQVCENCKCATPEEPAPEQPLQAMAWGVKRIGANSAWVLSTGSGVKVAIIDSGIDGDHLDLMDNIKGGYNAVNPRKSWNDDNGHGTHVAGIVAALDNTIGVVGVAPQAHLYAVKVLNRRGIGFASDIIDGLQWCIDHEIQVVNMSIGSSGSSQSYHDAIIAAKNVGITIVAAAGNNGEYDGSIVWPAKWSETIAVSATNESDGIAYFSSYGEEIDLAAPGQDINSTWNDGYYHVGSGTSMATPHVAGTVALILADADLKCDTNLDGTCSPDEVQARLETTAEWLSGLTSDEQGFGLVDAEAAVIE